MTRKRTTRHLVADNGKDISINMPEVIWSLLSSGKTQTVLCWKEFETRPERLVLLCDGTDDSLLVKVEHMDRVFGGYHPEGYPEGRTAQGNCTRFTVEVIKDGGDAAQEQAQQEPQEV